MTDSELLFSAARGRALSAHAATDAARCALFAAVTGLDDKRAAIIFYRIGSNHARRRVVQDLVQLSHGSTYDRFMTSCSDAFRSLDEDRNNIAHWPTKFNLVAAGSGLDVHTLYHPLTDVTVTVAVMEQFFERAIFFARITRKFALYLSKPESMDTAERSTWDVLFRDRATYPPPNGHPLAAT